MYFKSVGWFQVGNHAKARMRNKKPQIFTGITLYKIEDTEINHTSTPATKHLKTTK